MAITHRRRGTLATKRQTSFRQQKLFLGSSYFPSVAFGLDSGRRSRRYRSTPDWGPGVTGDSQKSGIDRPKGWTDTTHRPRRTVRVFSNAPLCGLRVVAGQHVPALNRSYRRRGNITVRPRFDGPRGTTTRRFNMHGARARADRPGDEDDHDHGHTGDHWYRGGRATQFPRRLPSSLRRRSEPNGGANGRPTSERRGAMPLFARAFRRRRRVTKTSGGNGLGPTRNPVPRAGMRRYTHHVNLKVSNVKIAVSF